MRVSICAMLPSGSHIFNYSDANVARTDEVSALRMLTSKFGQPFRRSHMTKTRQRIEYTFKNGTSVIKTIQ